MTPQLCCGVFFISRGAVCLKFEAKGDRIKYQMISWRHKVDRLSRIRERLAQAGLDAALITDEKNQRYATGFAFTDGAVVVPDSDTMH